MNVTDNKEPIEKECARLLQILCNEMFRTHPTFNYKYYENMEPFQRRRQLAKDCDYLELWWRRE